MTTSILLLSDPRADLATVGGKGASLARLARAGFSVPDGFHVTTAAYRRFVAEGGLAGVIDASLAGADPARPESLEASARGIRSAFEATTVPADLAAAIAAAYEALVRAAASPNETAVAVRSSATAEDLPDLSFAGQQESFLDVRGSGAVLDAVRRCWASLWTGRAIAYRAARRLGPDDIALAVVVQVLVDAASSGVMFTADPTTGRRDRLVIDAAWGLGEAIVGGRVTPDVLVVDKATRGVVARSTSDKDVRTVRRGGGTGEEPVPRHLRGAVVLDDEAAAELAGIGVRVEALYDAPMDIEWARADGRFHLVQARPITALPDAEPAPPAAWDPPIPRTRWSRGSVVDFLPAPLSPLFATLGLRVYSEAFNDLIKEKTGLADVYGSPYAVTINGYAYLTLNFTTLQMLTMTLRMTPKVIAMMRRARPLWEAERDRYRTFVTDAEPRDAAAMSPTELLDIAALAWHAASRQLSVFQLTGASAALSEMLLTRLWERDKVRRRSKDDSPASALLLGFESAPIRADRSLWSLTELARSFPGVRSWLEDSSAGTAAQALASGTRPQHIRDDEWTSFRGAFLAHLDAHGRVVHVLDFMSPTPFEEPQIYLATMVHWLSGHGTDPGIRQAASAARREALAASIRQRVRGPRGWLFTKILAWAQAVAPLREDAIASIGYGIPLVRRMLLELGRRLAGAGALDNSSDVFWLEEAELRADAAAIAAGGPLATRGPEIRQRKALWRSRRRVVPPPTVPAIKKLMGFTISNFIPDNSRRESGFLKGVAASGGRVVAPARVVHGPEDFTRMRAGEVLVAAITTPAWTPLFALASAVVTDVGGPLSHGSIVAREYGIPAVLGTGAATLRLRDGDLVTVDGDAGTVRWEEAGATTEAAAAEAGGASAETSRPTVR